MTDAIPEIGLKAQRRGLVTTSPADKTDPVRTPRAIARPVAPAAVALAIGVAKPQARRAIMLGAYAGLRVSEIAAMHTDELRFDRPAVLTVRNGKGGKDRAVPMHPLLACELAVVPAGWVFPAEGGGHITSGTIRRWVVDTFAGVGVAMHPHQLRHGFATELARVTNGNLLLVAHVLGHESVTTTQGYTAWACGPEAAAVAMMWEAS